MSFGGGEILLLLAILWLVPVGIIFAMADSKGRSKHFCWWPLLLGWLGLIVAAILIAAGGSRKPA